MKNPPFCPNRDCPCYHEPEGRWFIRFGTYGNHQNPCIQRFRCRTCGTGFSTSTFSLDFHTHRHLSYHLIHQHLVTSSGIRDMARLLHTSCNTVSNRIARLARQTMAVSAELEKGLALSEDLVADGFESFVKTQYMPNNIHILAGKDSQFWFQSDYAQLTRKGKMTERQKKRNREIRDTININRKTIYSSFQSLVNRALSLQAESGRDSVTLFTDEHPQYRKVLSLLDRDEKLRLSHVCISSRKARTVTNPLFSVNYLDREIRKDNSDHVRETVQFARNVGNAMDRLAVYRFHHNFMKPYRISGQAADRGISHGEAAGLDGSRIRKEIRTLFTVRRFLGKSPCLDISDLMVWCRCLPTPLNRFSDPLPRYALA